MTGASIVVVGSLNADLVVHVDRFPVPGRDAARRRFDGLARRQGRQPGRARRRGWAARWRWPARSAATRTARGCGARSKRLASMRSCVAHRRRRRRAASRSSPPTPTARTTSSWSPGANGTFAPDRLAAGHAAAAVGLASCCCSSRSRWTRSSARPPKRTPPAPRLSSIPRRRPTVPDQLLALATLRDAERERAGGAQRRPRRTTAKRRST